MSLRIIRMLPACAAALAATLALSAAPAVAQMPTLGIGWTTSGDRTGQSVEDQDGGCLVNISLRRSIGAGNLTVNLMAHTVSGPDRLRDHGVPTYMADGSAEIKTRSEFRQTVSAGTWTTVAAGGRICHGNDRVEQIPSVIRVLLMPGAGYRVDPNRRWIDITVIDMDNCAMPDDRTENGGVVYQFNESGGAWGTCTCATESQHPSVRRALDRTIPTPGDDGRYGTDDDGTTDAPPASTALLRSLAGNFHDPSYLYCEESPYKGLPE